MIWAILMIIPAISGEEICITSPSFAIKMNQTELFASAVIPSVPSVISETVTCPQGSCKLWGDTRTEFSQPFPGLFDVSKPLDREFLYPRTSSSINTCIISNILQSRGSVTNYNYEGCGDYPIFYEGIEFSPFNERGCACTNGEWARIKKDFYKNLYNQASHYKCLSIVSSSPVIPSGMTITRMFGCGGQGSPVGLELYEGPIEAGDNVRVRYGGLSINSAYLIVQCFYSFISRERWRSLAPHYPEEPFLEVRNDQGKIIYRWKQTDDDYPGGQYPENLKCDSFVISGTSYYEVDSPRRMQIVTTRYVQFTNKKEKPTIVQVVESKWSPKRVSDSYTQVDACNELKDRCKVYTVNDYWGLFSDEMGSERIRSIFEGIRNTQDYSVCDGAFYKGGCPMSCKDKTICKGTSYPNEFGIADGGMITPISSDKSFPGVYKEWTIESPAGVIPIEELNDLSRIAANQWNQGEIHPGNGKKHATIIAIRNLIESIKLSGFKEIRTGRYCMDVPCENCDNLFDSKTGYFDVMELIREIEARPLPTAQAPPSNSVPLALSMTALSIGVLASLATIFLFIKANKAEMIKAATSMTGLVLDRGLPGNN